MGTAQYDALLLVSFGGPEGPAEVLPFLERVTDGRGIPPERLREVAEHYQQFGGISPINARNRELVAELTERLELPVFWGNRNSPPYLSDALAAIWDAGHHSALAFVTSAYGSYPGCRQYREDISRAQRQIGADAPAVHKLRAYYNHPLFVSSCAAAVKAAADRLPAEPHIVFTAHSIPVALARTSPYVPQLGEAAALVARAAGVASWSLAWQSRSGPPSVPWLEPDVADELRFLRGRGATGVVVAPIGFVSDHMEVVYDLDTVAVPAARADGLEVERAATPGRLLVDVVAALVAERLAGAARAYLGRRGPAHDGCPLGCCPAPRRS